MSLPHTRGPADVGGVAEVERPVVAGTGVVDVTEVALASVVVVPSSFALTGEVVVPHADNTAAAANRTAVLEARRRTNRRTGSGRGRTRTALRDVDLAVIVISTILLSRRPTSSGRCRRGLNRRANGAWDGPMLWVSSAVVVRGCGATLKCQYPEPVGYVSAVATCVSQFAQYRNPYPVSEVTVECPHNQPDDAGNTVISLPGGIDGVGVPSAGTTGVGGCASALPRMNACHSPDVVRAVPVMIPRWLIANACDSPPPKSPIFDSATMPFRSGPATARTRLTTNRQGSDAFISPVSPNAATIALQPILDSQELQSDMHRSQGPTTGPHVLRPRSSRLIGSDRQVAPNA